MGVGRFLGGVGAVIWDPEREVYLLLRRASDKDFAPGVWECVTGRVDQGEGFERAVRREIREELGVEVEIDFVLGTTHFHRGDAVPENELIGVIYHCSIGTPDAVRLDAEHDTMRWVTPIEAMVLLRENEPTEAWLRRVIARAEVYRALVPASLIQRNRETGFELG